MMVKFLIIIIFMVKNFLVCLRKNKRLASEPALIVDDGKVLNR